MMPTTPLANESTRLACTSELNIPSKNCSTSFGVETLFERAFACESTSFGIRFRRSFIFAISAKPIGDVRDSPVVKEVGQRLRFSVSCIAIVTGQVFTEEINFEDCALCKGL